MLRKLHGALPPFLETGWMGTSRFIPCGFCVSIVYKVYVTTCGSPDDRVFHLYPHKLKRHVRIPGLVQHVGIHARLKSVLLVQLLGGFSRVATCFVIDHQRLVKTRGIGAQEVDSAFGIAAKLLAQLFHAQREKRHLGTNERPRKRFGTNRRAHPPCKGCVQAYALRRRKPPIAALCLNTLRRQRIGPHTQQAIVQAHGRSSPEPWDRPRAP